MKILLQFNPFTALILVVCIVLFSACELLEPEPSPEEALKANADFNNKLIPGLGNIFYESNLIPNSASQLVSIIQYKGDTLALLGKVNAAKKLENIHTTIHKRKNSDQLSVTEFFQDQNLSRNYIIEKGKRGRFVVEIQYYNATDYTISIVDFNWNENTSKILTTAYIQDGVEVDRYNSARILNNECKLGEMLVVPLEEAVKNGYNYISCKTKPISDEIDKIKELTDNVKDKFSNPDDKKQLEDLPKSIEEQQEAIDATSKGADWKHNDADLEIRPYTDDYFKAQRERDLKRQEEREKAKTAYINGLSVSIDNPYLIFDELNDDQVVLKLKIKSTTPDNVVTDPIPMFVTMNSGEVQLIKPYDPSKEFLTFGLYPPSLKDFKNIEDLATVPISYGADPKSLITTNLTIRRINPQLVESFAGANNQSGPPAEVLGRPLVVRVTDYLSRPLPNIPVQWNVTKGNGFLVSDAKTDEDGFAESKWTLGNNGEQEVEVLVKRRNGSLVNGAPHIFKATVVDSLTYYNSIMPGTWRDNHESEIFFKKDFTGTYAGDNTLWRIEKSSNYKYKSGSDYILLIRHLGTRRTYLYSIKSKGNLLALNAFLDYNW